MDDDSDCGVDDGQPGCTKQVPRRVHDPASDQDEWPTYGRQCERQQPPSSEDETEHDQRWDQLCPCLDPQQVIDWTMPSVRLKFRLSDGMPVDLEDQSVPGSHRWKRARVDGDADSAVRPSEESTPVFEWRRRDDAIVEQDIHLRAGRRFDSPGEYVEFVSTLVGLSLDLAVNSRRRAPFDGLPPPFQLRVRVLT